MAEQKQGDILEVIDIFDSNFPTTEHDIMVWADKNNIGRSKIGTTFKYNRSHDRLGRFSSGGGSGGGAGGVRQQNAMADENSKPLNIGDKVVYQPIGERRIATTITDIGSKGDPEEPGEERTVYDTASGHWGYRDQFTTAPTFNTLIIISFSFICISSSPNRSSTIRFSIVTVRTKIIPSIQWSL